MIPRFFRATRSRTCCSLVVLGTLAASMALASERQPDSRTAPLASKRGGQFELTPMTPEGPQLYQVRLVTDSGAPIVQPIGVLDAEGDVIQKLMPLSDGTFRVAGLPGQKFLLTTETSEALVSGDAVALYLPANTQNVIEVTFGGTPSGNSTHSAGSSRMDMASGAIRFDENDFPTNPAPMQGGPLCDTAVPLSVGTSDSGTTVGAGTGLAGGTACGTTYTGAPVVWYSVTGNGNMLTLSTCTGTAYDSKIFVFRQCGTPCSSSTLICVAGNDDFCGLQSTVSFASVTGQIYKVALTGFGAGAGPYTISLANGAAASGVACPPPKGACCTCLAEPFNCSQLFQADCTAIGGTWTANTPCRSGGTSVFAQYDLSPGTPIPDNNPAGITSVINVPVSGVIEDVNIELDINHTWIADLDITVTHNANTEQLWDNRCGSSNNIHATADMAGTVTLCATINAGPADTVRYSPAVAAFGNLADFNTGDGLGNWSLFIVDQAGFDVGVLVHWAVELTQRINTTPFCPVVTGGGACDSERKVTLCHYPGGSPDNRHEITISENAVDQHLDHGDTEGCCP